ncbi:TrkA C-terminal domain-containing protein [Staphylococcus chromogenes]|nr:TrkA C-terminal domain-containing protein [Staphylococcus chromogenes]
MLTLFSSHVLLTIFLVITFGTIFGLIPFGPIKFGAAGALFIGLLAGAFVAPDPDSLKIIQEFGLGIFVYMLGLEAGETFFKDLRKQLGIMGAALVACLAGGIVAVLGGKLINIGTEVAVGVFAGSLTSTPSLALAQKQTGSALPAVGYSIGYPTGVAVAILIVAFTLGRDWKAKNDRENPDAKALKRLSVVVNREDIDLNELVEEHGDQFVLATIRSRGKTRVAEDISDLRKLHQGDVVTFLATKAVTQQLIEGIGHRAPRNPFVERQTNLVELRISNRQVAGNKVADLDLYGRFQARIVRVRRGDELLLANDDTYLALGDILEIVVTPRERRALRAYLGDSIQSFAELDWVATAGGLFLGYLAALITIPLPGGNSFDLGASAGPLLVGMILGALQRTGPIAWQVPRVANYSLRQLGLMMFLAAIGIMSGPAFARTAFSWQGLKAVCLGAVVTLVACGLFLILSRMLGQSTARTSGGISGVLGQPAVLQYGMENSTDSRIMPGYSATFAVALVFKIVMVPFLLMLA